MRKPKTYFVLIAAGLLLAALYFFCGGAKSDFQHSSPLPQFLTDQIEESVKNLSIQKMDMESTWNQVKKNPSFIRYKLIRGQFAVSAHPAIRNDHRYLVVTESLEKLFQKAQLPDLDFIVCLEDSVEENIYPGPIFTFATKRFSQRLIPMPDPTALNPHERSYITEVIRNACHGFPWESKTEKVFWRGTPNGPSPSDEDIFQDRWETAPRFQLVQFSLRTPRSVDAGFISPLCEEACPVVWPYTRIGIPNASLLKEKFPIVKTVHPIDHLPYKYLIDVDGNSCCYSRTYWILASNSLLLKQMTDNCQWYYKGLKPYVHFVPVREDLSDLFDQIAWCMKNDAEARKISETGTAFALNHLQFETNIHFLQELLRAYASRMQYTPSLEEEDQTDALIPAFGKIYHTVKAFLRKKLNKPILTIPFEGAT